MPSSPIFVILYNAFRKGCNKFGISFHSLANYPRFFILKPEIRPGNSGSDSDPFGRKSCSFPISKRQNSCIEIDCPGQSRRQRTHPTRPPGAAAPAKTHAEPEGAGMETKQELSAIVSEITNFSTRDGPGIRTTVFLKGCPLRCKWCSNPETWEKREMLFYIPKRCHHCGACEAACPQGAINSNYVSPFRISRRKCDGCMKCKQVCLYDAFRISGQRYTVDELMAVIERDKCFYGTDGGVTVSGGEPLSSGEFVLELFKCCKAAGIGTVLDTTGYGNARILQEILA